MLAIGQLGGMLHLATAPHGVCWEHGVVVELDPASAATPSPDGPVGLARVSGAIARSDQHPHCPALWVLRQARLERAGSAAVVGCSLDRSGVIPAERPAAPDPWVLLRAPKHSPPA